LINLRYSEDEGVGTSLFLLGNLLEVLIDDCHCEEDTCARTDGSHEVGEDGESSNADSTEGGSGRNVAVEVLDHRVLSHTFDDEFLVDELSSNVSRAGARDIDPNSGEESAGREHEGSVYNSVHGVSLDVVKTLRWADVVSKSANRCLMTSHVVVLPLSKEGNNEVSSELSSENLSEEIDVADESTLKDNGDVGGVEQLDGVRLSEASHLSA